MMRRKEREIKMPNEPFKSKYLRRPAAKTAIKELFLGEYVLGNEEITSHIITETGEKIFRLNIMATIVNKEKIGTITNFLIDDGSEKIILRLFEENKDAEKMNIGDVILVIGRPRTFNNEKYISPEIIKKINPLWLKVRFMEISKKSIYARDKEELIEEVRPEIIEQEIEPQKEEININKENINKENYFPFQKICRLISELDKGEGVFIEEIIEKSPFQGTEEIIGKMLEKGDLFQNLPGRVRIL
ncbi:MAG: hypothetical protein AB1668_05415 [Nanoarchaeota archaeon]